MRNSAGTVIRVPFCGWAEASFGVTSGERRPTSGNGRLGPLCPWIVIETDAQDLLQQGLKLRFRSAEKRLDAKDVPQDGKPGQARYGQSRAVRSASLAVKGLIKSRRTNLRRMRLVTCDERFAAISIGMKAPQIRVAAPQQYCIQRMLVNSG
jgi:hypothetical protein